MRKSIKDLLQLQVLTSQEAAEMLGVHPSAIRAMVTHKKIDCVKKGKTSLIDREDIKKLTISIGA